MKKPILLIVGFFMALLSSLFTLPAHASFPATSSPNVCTVAPCFSYIAVFSQAVPSRDSSSTLGGAVSNYLTWYNASQSTFRSTLESLNATNNTASLKTTRISGGSDVFFETLNVSKTSVAPSAPSYSCPSNSTLSGSACSCNVNFQENSAHNACEPEVNLCAAKAGKPGITNWTVGYSRTPEGSDLNMVGTVNKIPADKMVCDSGCTVEMTSGQSVWQSQTPTDQGLYRWSLDVVSVPTGAKCTSGATDAPANKATPNPVCPGYVGEINGVKGCYGTASAPVTTAQADRPSSGVQPGNPAAGEKPLTGEGSGSTGAGRTPSTGTGGAAGGPASAANNALGNGTIPKPPTDKEQQACGAPGQPKCGIDETGTPDGKGVLPTTDFNNKLKEMEDALPGIVSPAGKDTSWGVVPQWTQAGTCSPWHVATMPPALGSFVVTVDLCPHKAFTDGIANFIWLGLAFFGITGLIFSTMTSKAS